MVYGVFYVVRARVYEWKHLSPGHKTVQCEPVVAWAITEPVNEESKRRLGERLVSLVADKFGRASEDVLSNQTTFISGDNVEWDVICFEQDGWRYYGKILKLDYKPNGDCKELLDDYFKVT